MRRGSRDHRPSVTSSDAAPSPAGANSDGDESSGPGSFDTYTVNSPGGPALVGEHDERRQRHRQHDDGRELRLRRGRKEPTLGRRGEQDERELPALRHERGACERFVVRGAEEPGHDVNRQALHEHHREHGDGDELPVVEDDPDVERHPDREEEQPEQDAAKRLDVGLDLMAEGGAGEQHAGEERAEGHREPAELHEQRRAEHDEQRRGGHDLASLGGGQQAEQRI